jgi:hypothetical protein
MEGEPVLAVAFSGRVGVSEEDWKAYQQKYGEVGMAADRVARDCLSTLGIPTLANTGDIAGAVEGFAVEWQIVSGSPEHGHDRDADQQYGDCKPHQGRLRCKLEADSDHSGQATFLVDVTPGICDGSRINSLNCTEPETAAVHETGIEQKGYMKVCAAVDASEVPSLSTFINGAMGGVGIADPIAELAGGMILKLGKPEGCTTLEVTYHIQGGWKVNETFSASGVAGHYTGLSCGSPYGPWQIEQEGTFPGGNSYGSVNIPFSENGKAPATFEAHVRAAGVSTGSDTAGTSDAVIVPNSTGYQINFGTFEMPGTCWGPDVSVACEQFPITGLVFDITPADPGQCPQP